MAHPANHASYCPVKKAVDATPDMCGCGADEAEESIERNVWGTDKSMIDADEFCVECEREVPFHYDNCPLHPKNRSTTTITEGSA